jgi:hypothetical protein
VETAQSDFHTFFIFAPPKPSLYDKLRTMAFSRLLKAVLVLSLLTLSFVSVLQFAHASSSSDIWSTLCDQKGKSGKCYLQPAAPGGNQAYSLQVSGHVEGHGAFGGSGGRASLVACLNASATAWTGSCRYILSDTQIGDGERTPSGEIALDPSDYSTAYAAGWVEIYANDATWEYVNATLSWRKITIDSFSASPSSVETGSPITVSWAVDQSVSSTRTLEASGAVSGGYQSIPIGASGSLPFTAGSSAGTATFKITAEGPGGNGLTTVWDDATVTVTQPVGFVNLNFNVKNQNSQAVAGGTVTINQDFGNGTSRTTDGSGFANFGVDPNTNIGYTATASGCNSVANSANSGSSGTTVNVTLNCSGGTPTCQDPYASNPNGPLPCTYPPGTVTVNATCNGNSASGFPLTFNYSGALNGQTTQDPPYTFPSAPLGTYTLSWAGGNPNDCPVFIGIDPSSSQTLGTSGITFTFKFTGAATNCTDPSANNEGSPAPCTYTPIQCTDNARLRLEDGYSLPSTMSPGQSVTFKMFNYNPGSDRNSLWYANGYKMIQLSSLNLSPADGQIINGVNSFNPTPDVRPGEGYRPAFTLTAPTAPGTYTLHLVMLHNAGWELYGATGHRCDDPTPQVDREFGQDYDDNFGFIHTFTVPAPTPTLTASFSVTPTSGNLPLNTAISMGAGGTATGPINYYLWWNCSHPTDNALTARRSCGDFPNPASGQCASNATGMRCNSVNSNPQTTSHAYTSAGTYTAKMIVERQGVSAENRIAVAVNSATTATLTANPSSINTGASTNVSWVIINGPASKSDWIGVYPPLGADQTSWIDWFYTSSCARNRGGSGRSTGTCPYAFASPGTYEFRLFQDDGWTKLATSNQVTVTTPVFDYSLSNSGVSSVTKTSGNAFTQNTITKTLQNGTSQAVTLSLSGVPANVTYSISNSSCSPNCSSVITFTVAPSAPVGTHRITVTGSPLGRTTTFSLVINGSAMSVSCSASPTTATLGQNVTWTGTITGGTPPLTYRWAGTNIPTNPAPSTNPYTRSYSTTGTKTATLTVTDADGLQATCPQQASAQINFDPNFKEF